MRLTSLGPPLVIAALVASIAALAPTTLRATRSASASPGSELSGVRTHHATQTRSQSARVPVAAVDTRGSVAGSAAEGAVSPSATAAGRGGTTGGTSGTNAPAGPFSDAPTDNLFQIASHLSLRHKSVTTVVAAPAGLPITNPVEISILFGTHRITRNYTKATINRFVFNFDALDGVKRRENVTVSLRDDTPTGPKTYALLWTVDIEPLFDVTISPLRFIALDTCDPVGSADPVIRWVDPNGTQFETELDGDAGLITSHFAGTLRQVGISSGLTLPNINWYDDDFGLEFKLPPPRGLPLLPGQSHHVRMVLDGGDCDGRFDFDVTLALHLFAAL
jgi:hypothetical protein